MSDEKFTQGEWAVYDNEYYLEIRCGYAQIGDVCASGHNFDNGNCTKGEATVANANLISAAPDMYRVLREINTAITKSNSEIELADRVTSLCHNISEALYKADGENK